MRVQCPDTHWCLNRIICNKYTIEKILELKINKLSKVYSILQSQNV